MRTAELEYRLLYSMVVAGKSAAFADSVLRRLFRYGSPFEHVRSWTRVGRLDAVLREVRSGNYAKLTRGFAEAAASGIDLRKCTAGDLEKIHGIGPKTSRFFLLWTRKQANHAALDTHVLKWLRYLGHSAPQSTPSGVRYARLEVFFLSEASARGLTARQLDARIWDWCSTGRHINGEWPAELQRRN